MLIFYRFNLYFDVFVLFYIAILYHKQERIDYFDYSAFLKFLHCINLTIFKYRIVKITINRVSKYFTIKTTIFLQFAVSYLSFLSVLYSSNSYQNVFSVYSQLSESL